MARLGHAAAPAVHRLAPVLRRDRRGTRTPDPPRPARLEPARVLPGRWHRRPRPRRTARTSAAHRRPVVGSCLVSAVQRSLARPSTGGSLGASTCCLSSPSARCSCSPTTWSGSAVWCTTAWVRGVVGGVSAAHRLLRAALVDLGRCVPCGGGRVRVVVRATHAEHAGSLAAPIGARSRRPRHPQ